MYPEKLMECFKGIMDTGAEIGKLFDAPRYNDPAWLERLREHARALQSGAKEGLGLAAAPAFQHVQREAERVLGHYNRAGVLLGLACEAINSRRISVPDILAKANNQLQEGNKKVQRVVSEASKFLNRG